MRTTNHFPDERLTIDDDDDNEILDETGDDDDDGLYDDDEDDDEDGGHENVMKRLGVRGRDKGAGDLDLKHDVMHGFECANDGSRNVFL